MTTGNRKTKSEKQADNSGISVKKKKKNEMGRGDNLYQQVFNNREKEQRQQEEAISVLKKSLFLSSIFDRLPDSVRKYY